MSTNGTPTSAAKTQRINLRASVRQEALLRQAADSLHTSLSEFVLGNAVTQAERVLADQRWFVVSDEQFAEFERLLDTPLPSTRKLERLLADTSPVGQPFDLDH